MMGDVGNDMPHREVNVGEPHRVPFRSRFPEEGDAPGQENQEEKEDRACQDGAEDEFARRDAPGGASWQRRRRRGNHGSRSIDADEAAGNGCRSTGRRKSLLNREASANFRGSFQHEES